jgi:hypothetical protein
MLVVFILRKLLAHSVLTDVFTEHSENIALCKEGKVGFSQY